MKTLHYTEACQYYKKNRQTWTDFGKKINAVFNFLPQLAYAFIILMIKIVV